MNYFSVVLRIIFLMCIENYFFIGLRIMFRGIANLFLGLQCFAGLAVRVFDFLGRPFVGSAFKENDTAKHCQGKKQKRFSSFLQNLSGASSLCVRHEVFWTEDLIEETTKRLQDKNIHNMSIIFAAVGLKLTCGSILLS